ncbi:hypothetical protein BET04_06240 [Caminicella sporogenes]|nr:hypothetical protein BET04_06240 [Caminicella sporogenes]
MLVMMGDKTKIRKLERKDVDKMIEWGKHDEPIFYHYNFPYLSEKERDLWFKIKTKKFTKKCFAIENLNGELIGYISLRNIKFFKRESELGIVFNPDVINKGYGTDALNKFLDIYFTKEKMKTLFLKVGKFNKRAIRCYEKCGFEIINEVYEEFEEQGLSEEIKKEIVEKYKDFDLKDNKLMTTYYYMKITKEKYIIHKNNLELLITL